MFETPVLHQHFRIHNLTDFNCFNNFLSLTQIETKICDSYFTEIFVIFSTLHCLSKHDLLRIIDEFSVLYDHECFSLHFVCLRSFLNLDCNIFGMLIKMPFSSNFKQIVCINSVADWKRLRNTYVNNYFVVCWKNCCLEKKSDKIHIQPNFVLVAIILLYFFWRIILFFS